MEHRITELEIKVAFHEQAIADLSEVVTAQNQEITKITKEMQKLKERVAMAMSSNIADESEETPPPHY